MVARLGLLKVFARGEPSQQPHAQNESKQSNLGKRRFHSNCRYHAESGEALMQRFGITKGLKVLDLGCGDRRPFFHSLFNENRASQTGFADVT